MKNKARYSLETIAGTNEIDWEGIPSDEDLNLEKVEEEEVGNVGEFTEKEVNHFDETFREFKVKSNLVTIGADCDGTIEIVDKLGTKFASPSQSLNTSLAYARTSSNSQSISRATNIYTTAEKYHKNPMNREPPSILMSKYRNAQSSYKKPIIAYFLKKRS